MDKKEAEAAKPILDPTEGRHFLGGKTAPHRQSEGPTFITREANSGN